MTITELQPGEWYKSELEGYNSYIFKFKSYTTDKYDRIYSDEDIFVNTGYKYKIKINKVIILFPTRTFKQITEEEVNQLKAQLL